MAFESAAVVIEISSYHSALLRDPESGYAYIPFESLCYILVNLCPIIYQINGLQQREILAGNKMYQSLCADTVL